MICEHCGETILAVFVLRHNTSDRPVEFEIRPQYCPICGCRLDSA